MECSFVFSFNFKWQAWGHSTVVGPFGDVLATCEEHPTIVYATLDLQEIDSRRQNMPLEKQKRNDLYELQSKTQVFTPL